MTTAGAVLTTAAVIGLAISFGHAWHKAGQQLDRALSTADHALDVDFDADMDHTADIRSARMWAELDYTAERPYDQDVQP